MSNYLLVTDGDSEIRVPAWVQDHASFLRWATSPEAPEKGKYAYLGDHLWIEGSMETHLHNLIKSEIAFILGPWIKQQKLGRYYTDGMLMSRPDLNFSSQPDGMFVSSDSRESGKVTLEHHDKSLVLMGTPDMVLEVVSKSSTLKDQKDKKDLYHAAGVSEYWMVDSRLDSPELVIYRHTTKRYISVKADKGWLASKVFGRSFRLEVEGATLKDREVNLLMKE